MAAPSARLGKGPGVAKLQPAPVWTNRLQCVECRRVSRENERGWTARLTTDDEVLVYCAECDEREFGDAHCLTSSLTAERRLDTTIDVSYR